MYMKRFTDWPGMRPEMPPPDGFSDASNTFLSIIGWFAAFLFGLVPLFILAALIGLFRKHHKHINKNPEQWQTGTDVLRLLLVLSIPYIPSFCLGGGLTGSAWFALLISMVVTWSGALVVMAIGFGVMHLNSTVQRNEEEVDLDSRTVEDFLAQPPSYETVGLLQDEHEDGSDDDDDDDQHQGEDHAQLKHVGSV